MKVTRVMRKRVHSITPATTLAQAWSLMQQHRVRHLPVVWDGVLVGVVSDRDLLGFATRTLAGELALAERPVTDAMTSRPFSARHDATVATVARLMVAARIDCVPIVAAHDVLIGLVTSTDLLEVLSDPERFEEGQPFGDVLEPAEPAVGSPS